MTLLVKFLTMNVSEDISALRDLSTDGLTQMHNSMAVSGLGRIPWLELGRLRISVVKSNGENSPSPCIASCSWPARAS